MVHAKMFFCLIFRTASAEMVNLVKGKAMREELVKKMKQQPQEIFAVWEAKDKNIIGTDVYQFGKIIK